MTRLLTIALLCLCAAASTGCTMPPDPKNPELLQDGPFPNLSNVPPRPATMSLSEREQLRRDLMQGNQTARPNGTGQ